MIDNYDFVVHVLGIEGHQRGQQYDFCCPVHADRHPSASVNLDKGLWHCLACGAGGDLAALAMAVKGLDRPTATRMLRPESTLSLVSALQRATHTALTPLRRTPSLNLPGPYAPEPLDYLRHRGYTNETLQAYGVTYVQQEEFIRPDSRTFTIRDYVALPIRDAQNNLCAYCYRAAHQSDLRYVYTPGVSLATLWFGLQLHHASASIVVTEGALDSMWVAQVGFPALGLLGASANPAAKLHILLNYRMVTLFMDRDAAGARATHKWGSALATRVPLKVARYPKGPAKDPAELTPEQVAHAIRNAIPYHRWIAA